MFSVAPCSVCFYLPFCFTTEKSEFVVIIKDFYSIQINSIRPVYIPAQQVAVMSLKAKETRNKASATTHVIFPTILRGATCSLWDHVVSCLWCDYMDIEPERDTLILELIIDHENRWTT